MKSIRRRLTAGVMVATGVIFGIAAIGLDAGIRLVLVREFDAALKARALAVTALTTREHGRLDLEITGDVTAEFGRKHRPAYFQLWLPDGSTFARSASLVASGLSRPGDLTAMPRFWNLTLPDGEDGRAVGFTFVPAAEESNAVLGVETAAPPLALVLARRLDPVDDTLEALRIVLLVVGAGILTAFVVTVRYTVRGGLAPLAVLAERAANIHASSLGQRFPTDGLPAELAPICQRLNDLLARLERSFERERQFTADAAHELRTPIAELRSLAEVSLRWPEDPVATQRTFQDALEIAGNMEGIVNGLLALARCESGKQAVNRETVTVKQLVEEVWRPLADQAGRRQLRVTFDVASQICLVTDRALAGLILANLFSNAVEYTPVGGVVYASVEQQPGRFNLSVTNAVDNLVSDDLPHLFDRFWRKAAARTSSAHCGLGLALAKAAAELLGYTLQAEMVAGPKLVFTLSGTTAV